MISVPVCLALFYLCNLIDIPMEEERGGKEGGEVGERSNGVYEKNNDNILKYENLLFHE